MIDAIMTDDDELSQLRSALVAKDFELLLQSRLTTKAEQNAAAWEQKASDEKARADAAQNQIPGLHAQIKAQLDQIGKMKTLYDEPPPNWISLPDFHRSLPIGLISKQGLIDMSERGEIEAGQYRRRKLWFVNPDGRCYDRLESFALEHGKEYVRPT